MKSIFTNLGKLLLCGVVVAMVGCTDFKEDIRVVDEKVNTLVESTTSDKAALEQTIDALKKDVTDNYYTKQQIDAVQSAIEKSIADEVKDLEGKINEVNGAIVAATQQVTEAINGLDSKKADKTEVKAEIDAAKKAATDAIAAVTESLNKVKGELSADLKKVQDDLAKAKSDLEGKVGANTSAISALQSQVETLGAQMLEVYNMAMSMGIALQEDMNEIAADLGDEIDAVDAKAIELKNELLSLSDHLNEYEATTDLKLTELHGSLQALSTYLEEYEASIDAKFAEINNTFESLSQYLKENMVTGEEFAAKFAETDGAITALTNLLSDLEAKHDADLEAVYEEINSRFNTTNEALSATLLIIEDLAAELKAEDETIYRELNITKEMLTSVYNEQLVLAGEVSTIQETLEARKEAAEAFKAEYDKKIAELEAEDNANLTLIQSIGTALNSYVEDLTAEIDLVNLEFTKVREEMTQMMNLLSDEMAAADEEIWNEIAKNNETAQTAISALMNYINDLQAEDENLWKEIYTLQEFATQNYQAIQQLQSTVETLVSIEDFLGWAAGHDETHQTLIGMIEGINTYIDEALTEITENAASDREQSQQVATALNNLIGDVAGDLAKLRDEVNGKFEGLDKVIENLENKLLDRIGAIEDRLDKVEVDVDALKGTLKKLSETLDEAAKKFADSDAKMAQTIQGLKDLCSEQQNQIGANKDEIYKNAEAIAKLFTEVARVEGLVKAEDAKLAEQITNVQVDLLNTISDVAYLKNAIKSFADLSYVNALNEESNKRDEKLEQTIKNLKKNFEETIILVLQQSSDNYNALNQAIAGLKSTTDEANKLLQDQIDDLVNRVQSLVYVPKYSDNLAPISYVAVVADTTANNRQGEGYLPRISTLTYKVNAKDAAAVAEALAISWKTKPETFDYDVTDVETRGASASGADLEIVNVTARDQYIDVEVIANEKFILPNGDDDDGIYSASLVISDGQNFRATEYTNLVTDRDETYLFHIGYIGEDGIPTFAYDALHTTTFMPANDYEMVAHAPAPEAYFERLADGTYLTDAEFKSYGLGIMADVNKVSVITEYNKENTKVSGEYEDMPNNGTRELGMNFFNVSERPDFEYDYKVAKTENNPWENKDAYSTVEYKYSIAGVELTATHKFALGNAQINVYVGAELEEGVYSTVVPWTVALEEQGYDEANDKLNAKDIIFPTVKWHGVDNLFEVLSGKVDYDDERTVAKTRAIGAKNWTVTDLPENTSARFFTLGNYDDDNDVVDIRMKKGNYSWNNEYEIVFVSSDDILNIDAVTTVNVKLVGKPEKIDVPVTTTFSLVNGKKWFAGDVNLSAAAYAKFEDYLGYGEANSAKWSALYGSWRSAYTDSKYGSPEVNDSEGARRNLWALLDPAKGYEAADEARLYSDDNIKYPNPDSDGLTENKITLTVDPWFDVPVHFTVTGEIVLPSDKLIFSDEHVKVEDKINGRAEAVGQIGADGKYSIILSDLAKYFNVDGELATNMKVRFEVTDPDIATQVLISPANETTVEKRTSGTYNYLAEGNAVLDWNNYEGTEVPIKATLIAEDFIEVGSLYLTVWTNDPLTLKGEGTVNNEGFIIYNVDRYPRKDAVAPVFRNLIATSVVEGDVNLIDVNAINLDGAFTASKAYEKYGAKLEISLGANKVYYFDDNDNLITIDKNKYTWNPETAVLVLHGDDATLRKPIYADFAAKLTHRICDREDKEVAIKVVFNHKDDALSNALALGGEVTLEEDLLLTSPILMNTDKQLIINLNGKTIKNVSTGAEAEAYAIRVKKGTLIIRGEGTVDGGEGAKYNIALRVDGPAKAYIEGGHFKVGPDFEGDVNNCIYAADGGEVYISGGKFESAPNKTTGAYTTLNLKDGTGAIIECTGGEFIKFNPQDNVSENPKKDFCKGGYHAELKQYTSDVYVVVKD